MSEATFAAPPSRYSIRCWWLNGNVTKDATTRDLGAVQAVGVAWIRLNGKDLDIVWVPPFRVVIQ